MKLQKLFNEASTPNLGKLKSDGVKMITIDTNQTKYYDHEYGIINWNKSKGNTIVFNTGTTNSKGQFSVNTGDTRTVSIKSPIRWTIIGDTLNITIQDRLT